MNAGLLQQIWDHLPQLLGLGPGDLDRRLVHRFEEAFELEGLSRGLHSSSHLDRSEIATGQVFRELNEAPSGIRDRFGEDEGGWRQEVLVMPAPLVTDPKGPEPAFAGDEPVPVLAECFDDERMDEPEGLNAFRQRFEIGAGEVLPGLSRVRLDPFQGDPRQASGAT